MSKVVIRAVQLEGFSFSTDHVGGQWLEFFDPDAHDGFGEALFTKDINKALKFRDIGHAFEIWKSTSTIRPKRPDGQPNRPLTAFTITFESVPD